MGVDADKSESTEETSADSGYSDADNDSCGCHIWDEHSHSEHLEAFYYAAKCAHECSLEKVCWPELDSKFFLPQNNQS